MTTTRFIAIVLRYSSPLLKKKKLGLKNNISKVLKGNLGISREAFIVLKNLANREIPHQVKVGHDLKINLEKNEKMAEFTSIILGDGNITCSKGNYRLDISLNNVDEVKYVEYVKNFMKSTFNQDPLVKPLKELKRATENEKGVNLQLNKASVVDALINIGLKPGDKTKNMVSVPNWHKETIPKKISSLKGLFDTDGGISVEKGDKSIKLTFTNASRPLVEDFKQMSNSLDIKTSSIHGPYAIKDPRTGNVSLINSISINSKDQVKKFLKIVKPMKWEIKYDEIGDKLMKLYPNTTSAKQAINEAFRYKRVFYSKKFALRLKQLATENGSYKEVVKVFRSHNIKVVPPRETVSKFIKKLFNEKPISEIYGKNSYDKWKLYNSNIIIENEKFKRFPNVVKKALSNEIVDLMKDKNKNDKVIMKKLEYIVNNKDLNGDLTNTSNKVLRYERLSYLWKYSKSKPIIRNYIENLIEITRTIIDLKKLNKKIPFSNIYDGHRMLGEKRAVRDLIKNITTKY